ncbi:unnamed protein product [Microthlaspi erraticum]|uniref:Pentacotripeptide-repeat region of PRORP domain-containing protein n=1 Tax=Microthlaspi erraticum TaxID=1685480 RepID=A0A6D2JQV4_9BRAS|nr:unnamed protein product [Microthlaspi erraticum]CAA7053932.1 unnamed protein product [Microthlaspi erraticum]
MLSRVCRSSSSSSSAARLISTRSIHRRVTQKGTSRKRLPSSPVHCSGSLGKFEGESLKLRSGFHYIESLDNAIELFDDMVRCRPFPSAIDFNKLMGVIVRMNRPDIVISLYQMMEMRRIPFDIYTMNIMLKCFCSCHKLPFALSTFGKITKLGLQH